MVSTPKPPDPYETASAQGAANRAAAQSAIIMNNANESTPYGSTNYEIGGYEKIKNEKGQTIKIPRYDKTVTLAPAEQKKLDLSNKIGTDLLRTGVKQVDQVDKSLSKPFSLDGAPARVDSLQGVDLPTGFNADRVSTSYASGGPVRNFRSPVGRTVRQGSGPQYQTSYAPKDGFSADKERTYQTMMSRFDEDMARDRNLLEDQLVSQGLQRGTEAFNEAMHETRRAENDMRNQAYLASGTEQSRLLGESRAAGQFRNSALNQGFNDSVMRTQLNQSAQAQDFGQGLAGYTANLGAQDQRNRQNLQAATYGMAATGQNNATAQSQFQAELAARQQQFQNQQTQANFQNAARQTAIQEDVLERTQPLNEISAFMSGGQVNVPQFQNQYRQGVEPSPVADLVNQNYQAQLAQSQAGMTGMFGMGSALLGGLPLMMSDRRTKTDIHKVGKTKGGMPVYTYRYKMGGPLMMGVMAQDVEKKKPEAVHEIDGIKHVDYSEVS